MPLFLYDNIKGPLKNLSAINTLLYSCCYSLGVVFVSVSDSTDLANNNLVDIAKEMGLVKGEEQQLKGVEQLDMMEQPRIGGMQQLVVGSKWWVVKDRQMENEPLLEQERERRSEYSVMRQTMTLPSSLQESEEEAQLQRR